jgi:hypothetical protein
VRDPNNIKQEGKGKMSKKKKILKTGGGLSVNWGIANPSNTQLTPSEQPIPPIKAPSLIQEPSGSINTMPIQPKTSTSDKVIAGIKTGLEIAGQATAVGLGMYGAYRAYKDAGVIEQQELREQQRENTAFNVERRAIRRELRDQERFSQEGTRIRLQQEALDAQRKEMGIYENAQAKSEERDRERDIEREEKRLRKQLEADATAIAVRLHPHYNTAYNIFNQYEPNYYPKILSDMGVDSESTHIILSASSYKPEALLKIATILKEYQDRGIPLTMAQLPAPPRQAGPARPSEEEKGQPPSAAQADIPSGYRNRKAKKSAKSTKSTIKKSKNLDAQILALLRA